MQTNKISHHAVPGGRVVIAGGGAVAGAVVAAGGTPVLTTPGGNVVPGTGGTGGPVVTPGGTIGGAVGLTPAKWKICSAVFGNGNDNNNSTFASFKYALSK